MGNYDTMGVSLELVTGIEATSAGSPADAATSNTSIADDVEVFGGTMPEPFTGNAYWNDYNFMAQGRLNVDNGTLLVAPPYGKQNFWASIGVPPVDSGNSFDLQEVAAELDVRGQVWAWRYHVAHEFLDKRISLGIANDMSFAVPANWAASPLWGEIGAREQALSGGVPGNYGAWRTLRFRGSTIALNARSNPAHNPGMASTGNVGIGTKAPDNSYKLQVGEAQDGTRAIAHAWGMPSSRAYKTDISVFGPEDYRMAAESLDRTDIVRFRYKTGREEAPEHIGVLAEQAPQDIVSADRKALNLSDAVAFLTATVKELRRENLALEGQAQRLEAELRSGKSRSSGIS